MVDLHTHILPGVDDGPDSMEESIELAKTAVNNGISTVVASPHHRNGAFDNPGPTIGVYVDNINEALEKKGIPLTVVPGQENRIHGELLEELQNGQAIPINGGRYVLVEFSSVQVPSYTEPLFYDMLLAGYIPIIVHPERNRTFLEHPEELYQLVKNGALTQVTAQCFTRKASKKMRQFAEKLVTHHLTHFVASDAHDTNTRIFDLQEAYDTITGSLGAEYTSTFQTNAKRVVENNNVLIDQPSRIKKKKFLGIF